MEPTTAARVFVVAVSGLFGLLVGSFLNVVIYRVPRGMSVVRPPSHCPNCDTELKPADNVPPRLVARPTGEVQVLRDADFGPLPDSRAAHRPCLRCGCLGPWVLRPLPSLLIVVAASLAAAAIDLDGLPIPWSVDSRPWIGAGSSWFWHSPSANPTRIGWAALGGGAAGLGAPCSPVDLERPESVRHRCLGLVASWLWAPAGLRSQGGFS